MVLSSVTNWLSARVAIPKKIKSILPCVCTVQGRNDAFMNLVMCDFSDFLDTPNQTNSQLIFFEETGLFNLLELGTIPCGVVPLRISSDQQTRQALAVAQGSKVVIYDNLQPYCKLPLSLLALNSEERVLWEEFKEDKLNTEQLFAGLYELKQSGIILSPQSLRILSLSGDAITNALLECKDHEPIRTNSVTCLAVLNKNGTDSSSLQCLVIGAEDGTISVIDPVGFKTVKMFFLCDPTHEIHCDGVYEKDYRLFVLSRLGKVYILRPDTEIADHISTVDKFITHLILLPHCFIAMDSDQYVRGFDFKRIEIFKNQPPRMGTRILSMSPIILERHNFAGYAISMDDDSLSLYDSKGLFIHFIKPISDPKKLDPIYMLKFGHFGREAEVLLAFAESGEINALIPKRNLSLTPSAPSLLQEGVLNTTFELPKKTKEFTDNVRREREQYKEIYEATMQEFHKLKLRVSEEYLHVLNKKPNEAAGLNFEGDSSFSINALLYGYGPEFLIKATVNTLTKDKPNFDEFYILVAHHDPDQLTVRNPIQSVPICFLSEPKYTCYIRVKSLEEEALEVNQKIRLLLMRSGSDQVYSVLVAAAVDLPATGATTPNEMMRLGTTLQLRPKTTAIGTAAGERFNF
ncbi:Bardet-Biedl syndrome 1 protein [Cichlidogyrus casuarinus]|uniref:Bardet-Biedl syndrome 1 protein n=1 Tax=Cichlidogyrus casuarinus TaxID=1844966 RepID=A0ABD2PYL3_9PLAT